MKKEVSHIEVYQSAKTLALMFFVVALIAGILYAIVSLFGGFQLFLTSVWVIALAVVIYPLFIFIYFAIVFAIYNLVAKKAGGITFNLNDK